MLRRLPPRRRDALLVLVAATITALLLPAGGCTRTSEPTYQDVTADLCDEIDVNPILDALQMTLNDDFTFTGVHTSTHVGSYIDCSYGLEGTENDGALLSILVATDDAAPVRDDRFRSEQRKMTGRSDDGELLPGVNSDRLRTFHGPVEGIGAKAEAYAGAWERVDGPKVTSYGLVARDLNLTLTVELEMRGEAHIPIAALADVVNLFAADLLSHMPEA